MNGFRRLSTLQQIKPDCIIYAYSKDPSELEYQEEYLKRFCQRWILKPIKIYKESGINFLREKTVLNNLLSENSNVDIIILDITRLSRDIEDLFVLEEICKEKNLRIFGVKENQFLFDDVFATIKSIRNEIKNNEKEL